MRIQIIVKNNLLGKGKGKRKEKRKEKKRKAEIRD
jgi:hypothetical protein